MAIAEPSHVHPTEPLSRPERRARLLAWRGVEVVLDVGAWEGSYGAELRGAGYSGRIVSFEPLIASYSKLRAIAGTDATWDTYQLALGSSGGRATLNVAEDSKCSSFLPVEARSVESAPESAFVAIEDVPVERLDALWSDVNPTSATAYMKVDAQGYELEVLSGAGRYLDHLTGLELELSLVPVYEGGPLWRQVVDYVEARGFRLASVESVFEDGATGEMLQVDGIFLRT
jgi:FkbM family methyltransferase